MICFSALHLWLFTLISFVKIKYSFSDFQYGPDPWDYGASEDDQKSYSNGPDLPLDYQLSSSKKQVPELSNCDAEEWFFKRILAILLKGGEVKKQDDGSTHVSIYMKLTKEKWDTLDEYLQSDNKFTEEKYRRSIGYTEDAILKPSIVEIVVLTWAEYISFYFEEYRTYITWLLAGASAVTVLVFLWNRMSHHHIYLILVLLVYFYEAFVSFKEAEQQEYNNFISALNTCKWYFWTSSCHISPPDPLIFLRHMHPIRIGMKIFTMLVSEPIITISYTVKAMLDGLTDDLWFPFNKLVYIVLLVLVNLFLIMSLLMVLFNFILNIPFNLSFFAGLIRIGVIQRHRSFTNVQPQTNIEPPLVPSTEQGDRISGQNLDKLLSFCAHAINNTKKSIDSSSKFTLPIVKGKCIKKSASAGRLTDLVRDNDLAFTTSVRYRSNFKREMGSGDN